MAALAPSLLLGASSLPPLHRPCPAPALRCALLSSRRRRFLALLAFPSRHFALPLPPYRRRRCCCCCCSARVPASNSPHALHSAEQLRAQLDSLQDEAQQVRRRAHSARLRFMRLTHVVEELRQRAAMDVRMGKEDSARLLLSEKQKVMKALEASRQRAELLEQLAGKLNVAISMKEAVLIEVLSSAPLRRSEITDDTSVHHVSPRTEGVSEETIQSDVHEDDIGSRAGLNSDTDLNCEGNADHNLE